MNEWLTCQLLWAYLETSSELSWWSWLFSSLLSPLYLMKVLWFTQTYFCILVIISETTISKKIKLYWPKNSSLLTWVLREDGLVHKTWMNLCYFTIYHCDWPLFNFFFLLILDAISHLFNFNHYLHWSFLCWSKSSVWLSVCECTF